MMPQCFMLSWRHDAPRHLTAVALVHHADRSGAYQTHRVSLTALMLHSFYSILTKGHDALRHDAHKMIDKDYD